MHKNFIIFLSLLLITSCSKAQNSNIETSLPVIEFSKKLDESKEIQLVDVRTPGEFRQGHLENAMNIDWTANDFEDKARVLDKNKPVFVYCLSGPRSLAAADRLKEMGFKTVYEMQGGLMKWRSANLPEKKLNTTKGISVEEFNQMLKSDVPVLVDFYAEWCAPCRKMEPYLKKISTEMADKVKVVRIDSDKNSELCKALGVSALPVLKLYKGDKIVWDNLGFVTEDEVKQQILNK